MCVDYYVKSSCDVEALSAAAAVIICNEEFVIVGGNKSKTMQYGEYNRSVYRKWRRASP